MRKQYKISAKYFLNKRLRAQEDNNLLYWPLYIQMAFHRKSTQIKTGYFMNELEFEKYQNGQESKAFYGSYFENDKGLLMPKIEPITSTLNKELEKTKKIILFLDNWLNKEYDITSPRLNNDLLFFGDDVYLLTDIGRRLDFSAFFKELKFNKTSFAPKQITESELTFFEMVVTSTISLTDFKMMCKELDMPSIISDDKIKHWIFCDKIDTNQNIIDWIVDDYPNNYKNNPIGNNIINCIKDYATAPEGIIFEDMLIDLISII